MKLIDMLKDRLKEDEELKKKTEPIKDLGIAIILSGILTLILFITMTFIFFYGSPFLLTWSLILLLLRFRICNTGIDVTLNRIIQKHLKISVSFK